MNLKIKIPVDFDSFDNSRLFAVAGTVFLISAGIITYVDIRIQNCRESLFFATKADREVYHFPTVCKISFDECLCPVLANRSLHSGRCIDDTIAMVAHIAPLVSFVLQICVIHDLFTLTGIYSGVVRHILWVLALFVFTLVAIGVHGTRCLHSHTSLVIYMTGILCFAVVFTLHMYLRDRDDPQALQEIDQDLDRAA